MPCAPLLKASPFTARTKRSGSQISYQQSLFAGTGFDSWRNHQIANYTQVAYNWQMKAVFVELPAFERHRDDYLDDDSFTRLQNLLMADPAAGDVIEGTGGLR